MFIHYLIFSYKGIEQSTLYFRYFLSFSFLAWSLLLLLIAINCFSQLSHVLGLSIKLYEGREWIYIFPIRLIGIRKLLCLFYLLPYTSLVSSRNFCHSHFIWWRTCNIGIAMVIATWLNLIVWLNIHPCIFILSRVEVERW